MQLRLAALIALVMASIPLGPAAAQCGPSSKIGIHLIVRYTPGARKIIQANCPAIKILDTNPDMLAALRDYKVKHPSGIAILRIYTPTAYALAENPAASAQDYWDKWLWPSLKNLTPAQKKLINYLEGPNEGDNCPTWANEQEAKWYSGFWLTLAPIMAKNGFRPCIGSIAVGNPPGSPEEVEAKIRAFVPALRAAKKLGGAWSYHGYTLKYTKDPGVEYWYSLRYRQFYKVLAKFAPDLVDMPMLLSEGGVDNDGNHTAKPGWKRESAERFIDWLKWYDTELALDPYVKGVTLFEIGHPENWDSFDLEPIADRLAEYLGK